MSLRQAGSEAQAFLCVLRLFSSSRTAMLGTDGEVPACALSASTEKVQGFWNRGMNLKAPIFKNVYFNDAVIYTQGFPHPSMPLTKSLPMLPLYYYNVGVL